MRRNRRFGRRETTVTHVPLALAQVFVLRAHSGADQKKWIVAAFMQRYVSWYIDCELCHPHVPASRFDRFQCASKDVSKCLRRADIPHRSVHTSASSSFHPQHFSHEGLCHPLLWRCRASPECLHRVSYTWQHPTVGIQRYRLRNQRSTFCHVLHHICPDHLVQDTLTGSTEIDIGITLKHCSQTPCEDVTQQLEAYSTPDPSTLRQARQFSASRSRTLLLLSRLASPRALLS